MSNIFSKPKQPKYFTVAGIRMRNPQYRKLGGRYYDNMLWHLIRLYVPHLDDSNDYRVDYNFIDSLHYGGII